MIDDFKAALRAIPSLTADEAQQVARAWGRRFREAEARAAQERARQAVADSFLRGAIRAGSSTVGKSYGPESTPRRPVWVTVERTMASGLVVLDEEPHPLSAPRPSVALALLGVA